MTYNLNPHRSGDTWKGISSLCITINGQPANLSGTYIEMQVRFSLASPSVLDLNTLNGGIVIVDATAGVIQIPTRVVDVPPAIYQYAIKLNYPSGEKQTYITGTWPIIANYVK